MSDPEVPPPEPVRLEQSPESPPEHPLELAPGVEVRADGMIWALGREIG